ncbi:hypothetical protein BFP77_08240 [Maribacter sp. 4U21]|uniref:hypothetical protein n=1 Tax=Maribacter sp. 4U21 TaxID=1889779 RepID=UPI000C159760|nr:hypothetical protein [Maribacter sp. 4U21]PIB28896.1 hypothetical protein BFP77_08240 [Maribacter sp. 4U21]
MNPTIGRVVVYTPTKAENDKIKGLGSNPQKEVPAIIVAVNEKDVNLKVLCDGADTLYASNVSEGKKEGQWKWPVIEKV